ncbi:MAG TPA: RidA family protein [Candidatus Lokiarchaeia archaeon]|nr:RidA family protein [Candidatus Lokiarchaeia archaeon]
MVDIQVVDTGIIKGGSFSQCLISGNLIFVSGQVGVDPETGTIPETIDEQTTNTLNNIKAILEKAGANASNIVKMTVFMTDIAEYQAMSDVYLQFFVDNGAEERTPTRTTVQVSALSQEGLKIEIDCMAVL